MCNGQTYAVSNDYLVMAIIFEVNIQVGKVGGHVVGSDRFHEPFLFGPICGGVLSNQFCSTLFGATFC